MIALHSNMPEPQNCNEKQNYQNTVLFHLYKALQQAKLNTVWFCICTYDTKVKKTKSIIVTNVMIVLTLLGSEDNMI